MTNSNHPVPIGRAGSGSSARLLQAHEKGWIPHTMALTEEWYCDFDITLAGALDNDTAQTFDLHTYVTSNPKKGILFPANVVRLSPAKVWVVEQATGATTCTLQVGHSDGSADTDAFMTASNVHTGGAARWIPSTPLAAEYARDIWAAGVPTITLTTTVENVDDITAFRCTILIPFIKLPLVS
jgi:hypothetical protein